MNIEQLEADLVAAQGEIEEAVSSAEKSKTELEALRETLKIQKVSWNPRYTVVRIHKLILYRMTSKQPRPSFNLKELF